MPISEKEWEKIEKFLGKKFKNKTLSTHGRKVISLPKELKVMLQRQSIVEN